MKIILIFLHKFLGYSLNLVIFVSIFKRWVLFFIIKERKY